VGACIVRDLSGTVKRPTGRPWRGREQGHTGRVLSRLPEGPTTADGAALTALLREVGVPDGAAARTAVAGGDPVLAARFPIGEAAATALAAWP
jgi:hypothetical protein